MPACTSVALTPASVAAVLPPLSDEFFLAAEESNRSLMAAAKDLAPLAFADKSMPGFPWESRTLPLLAGSEYVHGGANSSSLSSATALFLVPGREQTIRHREKDIVRQNKSQRRHCFNHGMPIAFRQRWFEKGFKTEPKLKSSRQHTNVYNHVELHSHTPS